MNGRLRRSIFLVLFGVTLAPAVLYAGHGPCGGLGERACCCEGDGRNCLAIPAQHACDDGLFEVILPPCGDAGSSTPSCGGCSLGWCARETSCGTEGKRACCSGTACEGDLIQDFRVEGECPAVLGPEKCLCGTGPFFSFGVCIPPLQIGERCNAATACADGLECQILDLTESRCYPGRDEGGIDDDLCIRLYDPATHLRALESGETHTFGTGASVAVGLSAGFESGVIYGRDGSYGCYLSTCEGLVTNVSAEYGISQGVFDLDFDGIAGEDCSRCVGIGTPLIAVGVGFCQILVGEECNVSDEIGVVACDPDAALCDQVGSSGFYYRSRHFTG